LYLLLKVIPNCRYLLRFEKTSKWNHFYYYVWAWRCTVLFIWIIIHQRGISCSGGTLVLTSAFVNKLEPTYVKRSYLNIWLDGFPNLICHMNVIDVWLFELNFLVVILASLGTLVTNCNCIVVYTIQLDYIWSCLSWSFILQWAFRGQGSWLKSLVALGGYCVLHQCFNDEESSS